MSHFVKHNPGIMRGYAHVFPLYRRAAPATMRTSAVRTVRHSAGGRGTTRLQWDTTMSRARPRFTRVNFPPPPPAYNVWRLAVVGSIEGQMTINNFFYHDGIAITSGVTGIVQNNLYNAFVGASGPWDEYKGALSADWTSVEIRVDSPTSLDFGTAIYPQGAAGLGAGGHEPTTVAVILSKLTELKGQCGRGHWALPAVPSSVVLNSTLSNLTAYNNLKTALLATLTLGGTSFKPVVFSKGTKQTPRIGYSEIGAITVRPVLGTCRRRKLGRGK